MAEQFTVEVMPNEVERRHAPVRPDDPLEGRRREKRLRPSDNVVVARVHMTAGAPVYEENLVARGKVPAA